MLRITHTGSVTLATIALDGKLLGPWVDELGSMMAMLGAKDAVRLNLEHLTFADAAGIEMLRKVRSDGVQLIGASPLIEGLLATPRAAAAMGDAVDAHE